MKRIGILGGTFDPVHQGHLALVRAAQKALRLDRVYLVPTYSTPLKSAASASASDRAAMLRLCARGIPFAKVSLYEVQKKGRSYTVDTLRHFKKRHPKAELFFIGGSDLVRTFPRWKNPKEILRLAHFAIAERPGDKFSRLPLGFIVFPMKPVPIASTSLRNKIRHGSRLIGVPRLVLAYIKQKGLYGV